MADTKWRHFVPPELAPDESGWMGRVMMAWESGEESRVGIGRRHLRTLVARKEKAGAGEIRHAERRSDVCQTCSSLSCPDFASPQTKQPKHLRVSYCWTVAEFGRTSETRRPVPTLETNC
uniref:Uncharacterized protein n=1 Tax=Micrurus corallinus TaxID=54390 RepID=A0A2D4GIE3_MICCO